MCANGESWRSRGSLRHLFMTEMAEGAGLGAPPVTLMQPHFDESWGSLSGRAGCGLVFGMAGACDVMIRAPMAIAIDAAFDLYTEGYADEFTLATWRWHSEWLMRVLGRQRRAFQRDPEWRREVWRALDATGLLGVPEVKV